MGRHVVGWFSTLRSSTHYRCHSVLLFSKGKFIRVCCNPNRPFIILIHFLDFIHQTFLSQSLTREKKKIRSEQYRQQVVMPSQSSSNSLPRQSQTQKPQSSANNLKAEPPKDSGYGKDIKGENLFFRLNNFVDYFYHQTFRCRCGD